jgi:hypothetical protein
MDWQFKNGLSSSQVAVLIVSSTSSSGVRYSSGQLTIADGNLDALHEDGFVDDDVISWELGNSVELRSSSNLSVRRKKLF